MIRCQSRTNDSRFALDFENLGSCKTLPIEANVLKIAQETRSRKVQKLDEVLRSIS